MICSRNNIKASWLHVSDLHVFPEADTTLMLDDYVELAKIISPEFLVVTGDFRHKRYETNFSLARDYLEMLISIFSINKQDVFLLPGNHDVDYYDGRADAISDICLRSEEGHYNVYSKYQLSKGFCDYNDFVREFYRGTDVVDSRIIDPSGVHCVAWNNLINILVVNTALISDGENHNQILDINALSQCQIDFTLFNLEDIRPGYAHYKKIDKLNETLCSLLNELKFDRELCRQVAVSIVTYSRFASVRYDFLDCEALDIQSCRCTIEKAETAMGDGLRTSLAQLDEMQNDLRNADNDYYTPILVFMTDGTPTDAPRTEFAQVRERVQNGKLFLFPLGIGKGTDMARLRDMFPMGKVPPMFSERYKMIEPEDYETIFKEIKDHVRRKQSVMVSEGNSIQSTPVVKDNNVNNNQTGASIMYRLLAELA